MEPDAVRARAQPLIGVSPADRIGTKLPCPLLVEGGCSVYRARPLVCRQATSTNLAACIDEFEGRDLHSRIPISGVHLQHASNAHITLLGAMRAAGFATDAMELAAALHVVLAEPDAEARWLRGEDVFKAVPRQVTREAELEKAISHVAAALRA
jgi:Fe-S-cluster containining protein